MSVIRLLLCVFLAALLPAAEPSVSFNDWTNVPGVVEGVVTTRPVDTTLPRPPLGYVEYLPKGYNPQDAVAKWPLLIMLAGRGDVGDGTDTAANNNQLTRLMTVHGPLYMVTQRQWDFPCIVLGPQAPGYWNNAGVMNSFITYAKSKYRIDDSRVYLTGLCEGGNGVVNFAGLNPGILAGILPIEVASSPSGSMAQNVKNLPMWASHCFADPLIARTATIAWVDQAAIADAGASNSMSTYPGYAGKNYHYAVDADPVTGKPLNASGPTQHISNCAVTNGDRKISWTSPTFGSAMFNSWGGTDAQPYAQVRINQGPIPDEWAKAGVMFRDSTAAGSRMVMVVQRPNNEVTMQWRSETGGGASWTGTLVGGTDVVKWVKLTKSGTSFTGSYSLDGSNWTTIHTQTISSASSTYLGGLAVTAHNNSSSYTQPFTNVSIAGVAPTALTNVDIGSPSIAGSATFADSTWTLTGGGADIWGSADQFHYAYTSVTGDQAIIAKVGTNTAVATNVVSVGKSNHLLLTRPYAGETGTVNISIQTPVGYNATSYFDPATAQWTWTRGQAWDRTKPSKRLFTMFWYQDHVNGWVETFANGDCWDWLFTQVKPTAPAITAQPQSITVADGAAATFTVTASGTEPTYVWKRDGTAISGATSASYTIPAVALADSGAAFTVVISNAAGTVTSTGAGLTVTAVAPAITAQPPGGGVRRSTKGRPRPSRSPPAAARRWPTSGRATVPRSTVRPVRPTPPQPSPPPIQAQPTPPRCPMRRVR